MEKGPSCPRYGLSVRQVISGTTLFQVLANIKHYLKQFLGQVLNPPSLSSEIWVFSAFHTLNCSSILKSGVAAVLRALPCLAYIPCWHGVMYHVT